MADTKISALPAASAALGAQELPVNDAGTSRKVTITQVQTFLNPALPTVVAVGTSATGTGAITPGLPAGHTTNDILLLFVQTDNQAITCAGYTQLGPVVGTGTAAAAGATRGTIFWKRDGGAESDPTTSDSGDHQVGQMMAIRGCPTTGNPFLNIGAVRKVVASVTATGSAGATPVDNCLVVDAFFHALDSASAVFSSPTNADLGSVTEQIDVATADGNGGGIGVITGTKEKAGNFTTTTATMTSGINMGLTFIMLPAAITSRQGFIDRQVFLTPVADTWTKPTGARMVYAAAIGGGASGSAGRNAATAAGGGGGGGGMWRESWADTGSLAATVAITVGAGGAATANTDGAASNAGTASTGLVFAQLGAAAGASASGSGGLGGNGGGFGTATAAGVQAFGNQPTGGGTGGTTAGAGGNAQDFTGGAGAGGGTTQATSAGGTAQRGGGGGGGGRSNTNVGTGGPGAGGSNAGGATAGASGTDTGNPYYGGGGGAGGTSAAGPGGTGGWPGGGGGGGGSQSGAQRGGAGADGVVVVVTYCG